MFLLTPISNYGQSSERLSSRFRGEHVGEHAPGPCVQAASATSEPRKVECEHDDEPAEAYTYSQLTRTLPVSEGRRFLPPAMSQTHAKL